MSAAFGPSGGVLGCQLIVELRGPVWRFPLEFLNVSDLPTLP